MEEADAAGADRPARIPVVWQGGNDVDVVVEVVVDVDDVLLVEVVGIRQMASC